MLILEPEYFNLKALAIQNCTKRTLWNIPLVLTCYQVIAHKPWHFYVGKKRGLP